MKLLQLPQKKEALPEDVRTLLEYWLAREDIQEIIIIGKNRGEPGWNLEYGVSPLDEPVWWLGALEVVKKSVLKQCVLFEDEL